MASFETKTTNKTQPRFPLDIKNPTYGWTACNVKFTCPADTNTKSCNATFSTPNSTIKFTKKYATVEAGEKRKVQAAVAEFVGTAK